ncbi:MAG: preprotein translocase subunit YajC, partial [Puniceicoccales bacterium]|nr:preprotein translocase subunit YajC [Puniceicoccales bacterium]
SGIFGKIVKVKGNSLTLEIAKGTRMEIVRAAVQQQVERLEDDGDDEGNGGAAPEKMKKR